MRRILKGVYNKQTVKKHRRERFKKMFRRAPVSSKLAFIYQAGLKGADCKIIGHYVHLARGNITTYFLPFQPWWPGDARRPNETLWNEGKAFII